MGAVHNAFAVLLVEQRLVVVERENAPGRFGLPGGRLEHGETPRDALVREAAEELGLEIAVIGAEIYRCVPAAGHKITAIYRAICRGRVPKTDYMGPEGMQVRLVDPEFIAKPENGPYWQANREAVARALANAPGVKARPESFVPMS